MTARTTPARASRREVPHRRRAGRRAPALLTLAVALTTVAGCASGGSTPATSTPATSTPATSTSATSTSASSSSGGATPATSAPSSSAADVTLSFTVTGGKATPGFQQVDVSKGQTVSITVTSDTADELHVHGYDKEVELPAGTPATVTFVADQTGQFEVETHESGLRLASLVVR